MRVRSDLVIFLFLSFSFLVDNGAARKTISVMSFVITRTPLSLSHLLLRFVIGEKEEPLPTDHPHEIFSPTLEFSGVVVGMMG